MEILQLVPALPPPHEGVGDYALRLAGAGPGLPSRFLALRDGRRGGAPAETALQPGSRALHRRLEAEVGTPPEVPVLVHYSNYGYARRGCPHWLVEGVARWRAGAPGRRLVTLFHELWATGPPWRSSFWLHPVQRRLALRLAAVSDAVVTPLEPYRQLLGRTLPGERITVLPACSGIGEPEEVPPFGRRPPRLAVFGTAGSRLRAYGELGEELERACAALGIEEVVDLGPPVRLPHRKIGRAPIRAVGSLPPAEVSRRLLDAAAGFLAYPPAFLPKSSIFAAYCSHGLVPVCAWPGKGKDGALQAGVHYWWPGRSPAPAVPGGCEEMAQAAHRWYQGHSLRRHVDLLADLLRGEEDREGVLEGLSGGPGP